MKNLIGIILSLACFYSFGQTYVMNSGNSGTTQVTCSATVYDNGGGGLTQNYGFNQNNVMTFCSSDGGPIRIKVEYLNVEFGWDHLYIYDGPTTGSPLLADLAGFCLQTNDCPGLYYTSSGTCLTVQFTSDNIQNYENGLYYGGYELSVSCDPNGCNGNLPADDNCANATQICSVDGYCGTTDAWYTIDAQYTDIYVGNSEFCGSIENNSWLTFTASETSVTIDVDVTNCAVGDGVQMVLFEGSCASLTQVGSNCWSPLIGAMSLTFTGLTVGNSYYLMVDGFAGDVCDYAVSVISGVEIVTIQDQLGNISSEGMCPGECATLSINSIDPPTSYNWYSIPAGVSGSGSTLNVCPSGDMTVFCDVGGICGAITTAQFDITMTPVNYNNLPANATCEDAAVVLLADPEVTPCVYVVITSNGQTGQTIALLEDGVDYWGPFTIDPTTGTINTLTWYQVSPAALHDIQLYGNYTSSMTYEVYDCANNNLLYSGSWNDCGILPCTQTDVGVFPSGSVTGLATWSSTCGGLTTTDWGAAVWDPATATGPFPSSCDITYIWDNESGCSGTETETVNISNPYSGTYSYTGSPFCTSGSDPTPTISGSSGGIFTSSPAGLSINAGSGTIDLSASTPGTYNVLYTVGTLPCGDTLTTQITINNPATGTDVQTACVSYTWIDGNTYSSSTNVPTYTYAGGAANGCDSTVTLNLTIINPASGTDVQTACNSYTWIDGNTYSSSTNTPTYTYVGGAANGCDSIVTLNLTINNPTTGTDVQTACVSYTWIDGNTYSSSTNAPTYTYVGGAANGCDSTVTLNLTINNPTTGTDVQTACVSYTWIDGNTYSSSTNTPTYTYVGGAANGCDSTVTLNLTINNPTTGTDVQTACVSYTWVDGNTYSSSTNTPTYTYVGGAANGCDSTVTLNLTINNPTTGTDVQQACNSYTWIDGNTYTSSTNTPTYTYVGGAANGCDSTVTLDLTINTFAAGTDVQTACSSYTWIDGNTYTSSTNSPTYTFVGGSINGCDSIVTLNLTINNPTTGTDVQTACNSYTWIDGNTYSSSTNTPTYTYVGGAANGCDSTVTLNLTINNPATSTDVQTSCGDYTWIDGNTYSSSTNTPTFTYSGGASNGCDSIVTLDLTINPVPTGIISGGGTYCQGDNIADILVDVTGTPNWTIEYALDGTPMTASGSTSPISLGNTPGVYVITGVTDANCSDTMSGTATIVVNAYPSAPVAGLDATYCSNDDMDAMMASGSGGIYTWYSDSTLSSILGTGSSYVPDQIPGTQIYYVTETNGACEGPASMVIITINDCDIIIPTAFTPGSDGFNDDWEIVNLDNAYPNNQVYVYNRWGELLFQSEKGAYDSNRWDGTFMGQQLPVGSYYFIIEFNDEEGNGEKGTVSIIVKE